MKPLADIVGDNATHLIPLGYPARWVQIVAIGSGTVRHGCDSTVSATFGLPLVAGLAGAGQMYPYAGEMCFYQGLYVYVPVGATVTVGYGQ